MNKILLFLFLTTSFLSAQTPRLTLVEQFTGETCGPCAVINPGMDALLAKPENAKRVTVIKWQVPIPSAPTTTWSLYQTNKTEIDWRYRSTAAGGYGYKSGLGISSAPSFLLDGWFYQAGAVTSANCASVQSYTSAFSITMDREWDATLSSVNLTVNIQATANFNATGNLVFRTVMVERQVQFPTQPGNNGETLFHDVAIRSFPTLQGGIAMSGNWTTGQTQTFTLNCPLPPYTRKKEEIAFVGFIQDDGNKKVAQAVRAEKQGIGLNDAQAVSMSSSNALVCNGATIPRIVVVRNNGSNTITGFTITPYMDGTTQTPLAWSGVLTNGAYKTLTLSPYAPSLGGGHSLSFKITGVSGGDSDLLNNEVITTFYSGSQYSGTPVAEGFSGSYPPLNWATINHDKAVGWAQAPVGAFNLSFESSFYNSYYNIEKGDRDELILPPLDLSGTADPDMSFDVAYVQRSSLSDTLDVLASYDCGNTWSLVYRKQGAILSTYPTILGSNFVPGASHWRTETFTLPGFNKPEVLVKFLVRNDNGNNLYIDNVNLSQPAPLPVGVKDLRLDVLNTVLYPNPSSGPVQIKVDVKKACEISLTIVDIGGRVVLTETIPAITGGSTALDLDLNHLSAGLYTCMIRSAEGSSIKKLSLIR